MRAVCARSGESGATAITLPQARTKLCSCNDSPGAGFYLVKAVTPPSSWGDGARATRALRPSVHLIHSPRVGPLVAPHERTDPQVRARPYPWCPGVSAATHLIEYAPHSA